MPCSQGQRSSSVSGTPLCIFSTFDGGWNQSPSSKIQFSRCASIIAIVLLPQPETPITTRTEGSGNGEAVFVCSFRPPFPGASGATGNADAAAQHMFTSCRRLITSARLAVDPPAMKDQLPGEKQHSANAVLALERIE